MTARLLFLGQKWLGDRCFDVLMDEAPPRIEVVAAVSNAAAANWWRTCSVAERARAVGLPFVDNAERNTEAIAELAQATNADTIVSVQHPWIVPAQLLASVAGRAFNLHSAKLPDYAGHNATNHAIHNGEREYTVTVHRMVAEVDSGDVAFEETVPVPAGIHARALYDLALGAGVRAFRSLIDALGDGDIPARPVGQGGRFYTRASLDQLRDATASGPEERALRARALFFPPFEPAFVREGGQKTYLLPDGFQDYACEFDPVTHPWR